MCNVSEKKSVHGPFLSQTSFSYPSIGIGFKRNYELIFALFFLEKWLHQMSKVFVAKKRPAIPSHFFRNVGMDFQFFFLLTSGRKWI